MTMSQVYSADFLKELNDRSDILSLVSQSTRVEKIGNNHLALCPFHAEQSPSLQVNTHNNTFYCHACGAGSSNHSKVKSCDAVSFLQHSKQITFPEAVQELARLNGMNLPNLSPEEQLKKNQEEQWASYCTKIADLFNYNLKNNEVAIKYLRNRGMVDLHMDIWKIGYGGLEPHNDFMYLKERITFPMFDY